MPKAAPDQVIIHRIEFQETERELLKTAMTAYSFRNVTKGVFNLSSDVTTVVLIIILLEYLTGKEILSEVLTRMAWGDDSIAGAFAEAWRDYRQTTEYKEQYHERAHSVGGGFINLLENFFSVFSGEPFQRYDDLQQERAEN